MRFLSNRWERLSYPDSYTGGDWLFFLLYSVVAISGFVGLVVFVAWLLSF